MDNTIGAPLMENAHVQELLNIMRDNNANPANVAAMINSVSAIERYMEAANSQLVSMRREISDMREIQKHPVKTALQNSIKSLESKYNAAMGRLGEVKAGIIEGCKNAVATFKEKSQTALNSIMKYFHVKDGLQSLKTNITDSIREDTKAIAKIEAFSHQYHETGKSFSNMGRVLIGKEPEKDAKANGKLAHALEAPYKGHRTVSIKISRAIKRGIGALDRLDHDATAVKLERAAEKDEKRSLIGRLDENRERVAREKLELPSPTRSMKPLEATI